MQKFKVWECQVCAWIYDEVKGCPEEGIAPGTRWEDIPSDWLCPECGVGKEDFDMVAISESEAESVDQVVSSAAAEDESFIEYSIWECQVCAWVYDESKGWPEDGIAPGTKWQDVPNDWLCPECGVGKADFDMLEVKRVKVNAEAEKTAEQPPISPEQDIAIAGEIDETLAPIVIIGTGLAGYNLVKEIRKTDHSTPIHLYTNDDGTFYSKPLLSTGFAKKKSAQDLAGQSAEQMAEQFNVQIHIYTPVKSVDTAAKTITLADGCYQPYSKLVFATGASCIQAPLTGDGLHHVYSVNDLLDYNKFRTLAKHKKHILIIGAGLIGSEYANDLVQAGHQVSVVDPMPTVLSTLMPEPAGKSVEAALANAGVKFHFGTVVESVNNRSGGVSATLNNGTTIEADIVLSAIGVRPNIGLAQANGIATGRGIVTDRYLATNAADVYAIGDCAQVADHVLFYILPMMAQIKALAKTLAGNPTEVSYGVMPVIVKTTLFPVTVNPPARNSDGSLVSGQWQVEVDAPTGVRAVYRQGEQVLGFALTGDQVSAKAELEAKCPPVLA
ncbi:FAD-dependent oxidoreductase [Colwellia sp. MEBiC06753]